MSSSNNQQKNIGASSSPFGNSQSMNLSARHQLGRSVFPSQYQLSPAQIQTFAQNQARAQAQAQAQAEAHALFQARLQAHLQAQGISLNQARTGGITNLGSPPLSVSGVGRASAKRSAQKQPMHPPPPAFSRSNTASPIRATEASAAAARRKKQKLPEKQAQERVAALLPESALYSQLLEFESYVDALCMRKKIDIQEALDMPLHIQKTLRIYVFNTFANQIRINPEKPNAEPPTWTLKIVGRILEEGRNSAQAAAMEQQSSSAYPKFSSFLKRFSIILDPNLYPDNNLIIWDSTQSPAPHEGFEVKRIGDQEFTAIIRFEMNYLPEKFKLSAPLKELLHIEVETRPRIMAAIWQYVKARKLQCQDEPTWFFCDKPLQNIFGEMKMKFTEVTEKIAYHLVPPQPMRMEHRIRLSGDMPVGNACYDVLVDVPIPAKEELSALLANHERKKELAACDEVITAALKKVQEHQRRRAFFLGFSQSPVEFINKLMDSQNKDLKLITGDASQNAEKVRHAEFYKQPWVEDAVIRYINRKAAGNAPTR